MRSLFCLCVLTTALGLAPATAQAQNMAVGAFTGINIPVAQADASEGSIWGIRVQLQPVSLLRVEPFLSFVHNGDYQLNGLGGSYMLDGGSVTGYGVNAAVGSPMGVPGVGVSLVAGFGNYRRRVDYQDAVTRAGYSGGLDVSIGLGRVRADGRGEFLVIPQDPKGSRKHVLLTLGASYAFGGN